MTQTPAAPAEPDETGATTAVPTTETEVAAAPERVEADTAPAPVADEVVVDEVVVDEVVVDEVVVDEVPVEPVADEAPAEPAADEVPTAPIADETPVEPAADVEPVPDQAPVEALADEPSAEAGADEAPVERDDAEIPVEPVAEEAPVPESEPAPAAPAPPVPGPRPSPASIAPRPRPVPGPPPATRPVSAPAPAVPPPAAPVDPVEAAAAAAFGRVTDEGTVYVQDGDAEREVGQVPGATADDALALYIRRFLDLKAKVQLFEARLTATDLSVKEIDQTLTRLGEELAEPAAVGDLVGLRTRLDGLRAVAAERRAAAEAERAAARQAALEARTAIVEQAEQIAATDPGRIQWRPAGEQLRVLLDQWKEAQRSGPRLDRPSEEALWKRFSHARTTFDRERRHFFAELESRNAVAKSTKEALAVEAERLAASTDWAATAGAFRDLMAQWKSAGRASRPVDDALWARFRAAQDAFFAARDAVAAATDSEYQANLVVKERLLTEAEALLPLKDLGAAKAALRSVQDRWDAAGKVPRGDIQRIEARLRAVEQAVRDADDSQWRRTNPETRARAEGMEAQLAQAIAGLEADLAKATAAGDARKVADVTAALDARRSWLEQVQRAARDARG